MYKIISVTNRLSCRENFQDRLLKIAKHVEGIVLREKDLTEMEYEKLAEKAYVACGEKLIIHNFPETAKKMGIRKLHVPLSVLRTLSKEERTFFTELGTSCHSLEDAYEAVELECTYIFAGHIFETDCKAGLPGRGLDFLRQITDKVSLPVYAIGGISEENISAVLKMNAKGVCVMSGLMTCENVARYIETLKGGVSGEI